MANCLQAIRVIDILGSAQKTMAMCNSPTWKPASTCRVHIRHADISKPPPLLRRERFRLLENWYLVKTMIARHEQGERDANSVAYMRGFFKDNQNAYYAILYLLDQIFDHTSPSLLLEMGIDLGLPTLSWLHIRGLLLHKLEIPKSGPAYRRTFWGACEVCHRCRGEGKCKPRSWHLEWWESVPETGQ